jgi:hypothetical protein
VLQWLQNKDDVVKQAAIAGVGSTAMETLAEHYDDQQEHSAAAKTYRDHTYSCCIIQTHPHQSLIIPVVLRMPMLS